MMMKLNPRNPRIPLLFSINLLKALRQSTSDVLPLLHALIFLQASTVNMPNTRQDPLVSVCFVTAVVSAVVAVLAAPCTAFVPPSNVAGVDLRSAIEGPTSPSGVHVLHSSSSDTDPSGTGDLSRRQVGELAFASLGLGVSFFGSLETKPTDYGLWGILPVGPYKRKKTISEAIVPDQVWTFDQKFGILNVQVPLRCTIIKLSGGGLFVYNPVAATKEFVGMVKDLEKQHGPVKHIALGSVAIEHKVYAGVFAQKFAKAKVWLQPGQYSFPSNLPDTFLGFPPGRTFAMPQGLGDAPDEWKTDFDFLTLGPIISRDGAFGETVFYHKATKTLLCTDTVVEVAEEVPPIFEDDPKPLLYHARDTITDVLEDTPEVRAIGWRRVQLFGLFFQPGAIKIKDA